MRLRERPNVRKVSRQCDILGGEQPSIEWYVDAELSTNNTLSWRLHLYWSGDSWVIETDVRRVHTGGSGIETEFATRAVSEDELAEQLRAASVELVRARPDDSDSR